MTNIGTSAISRHRSALISSRSIMSPHKGRRDCETIGGLVKFAHDCTGSQGYRLHSRLLMGIVTDLGRLARAPDGRITSVDRDRDYTAQPAGIREQVHTL